MNIAIRYIFGLLVMLFILLPLMMFGVFLNMLVGNEKIQRVFDLTFSIMIKFIKMEIVTEYDFKEINKLMEELKEEQDEKK